MKMNFTTLTALIIVMGNPAWAVVDCSPRRLIEALRPISASEHELNVILQKVVEDPAINKKKVAEELLTQAKKVLKEKNISFKTDVTGRSLHITAPQSLYPHQYPKAMRDFDWVYQPEILLDDVNVCLNPARKGKKQIYLSHLDLLGKPESELFQRQVYMFEKGSSYKKLWNDPIVERSFQPVVGYSDRPLAKYLRSRFGDIYSMNSFTHTEIEKIKTEILSLVEKELKHKKIPFTRIDGGKKLVVQWQQTAKEITNGRNASKSYEVYLDRIKKTKLIYDPQMLIDRRMINGYENTLRQSPLNFPWKNEAYLSHEDLLMNADPRAMNARPGENAVEMNRYIALKGVSDHYFNNQPFQKIMPSAKDPYFYGLRMDNSFDRTFFDVWGAGKPIYPLPEEANHNRLWSLFNTQSTNPETQTMMLNTYLSQISTNDSVPLDPIRKFIGFAYGLGPNATLLDFEFGPAILKNSLSESVMDSYLDYLEPIYKNDLKISNEQWNRLRELSNEMKDRSRLYTYVQDPVEKVASVKSAQELEFKAGMVSVASLSPSQPLPFEVLHPGVHLPRVTADGSPFSIAELGRLGKNKPEMDIDFMRVAITKLLEETKPPIRYVYIEVNGARARLFKKYGFEEVPVHFEDQKYYPNSSEKLMKVAVDEFYEKAFAVNRAK